MTTIAHISDTHFGTEIPEVVQALETALAQASPDIVILSGDITQRARRSEFQSAAAFVQRLPGRKKIIIPGNHDIPLFNILARFLTPYRNYQHAFGARESVWCEGNLGIIGLDATSPFRHVNGKLGEQQIRNAVAAARQRLPENAFLIACAHQPLFTAWEEDISETLIGRAHTTRLFSELGIDLVLSGHVHVPLLIDTGTAFPELPHHFILSGAGTAVSHRIRPGAPNSFNLLRIGHQVDAVQFTYNPSQSAFVEDPHQIFMRGAEGWKMLAL